MNPDQRLVDDVLTEVPGAFERLVQIHQGLCWHIIQRMVRNPEDSRDLCQETFLQVHRKLRQFRGDSALKTWIGRIAYHIALRHLQRRRLPLAHAAPDDETSLLDSIDAGIDLEADSAQRDIESHLLKAIEALPPLQRTVLTLYHLQELSIVEIAETTGLAAGTIKSHLFRSRLRLREMLEPRIGVCP